MTGGRRERKLLAVRSSLLAAGRELVEDDGSGSVSVEAIAERADVALGTFYNHFDSKAAYYDELNAVAKQGMFDTATKMLECTQPPHFELAAMCRRLCIRAMDEPELSSYGLSIGDNVLLESGPIDALHRAVIANGVSQGIFAPLDDVDLGVVMYRGAVRDALRHVMATAENPAPWKNVVYAALSLLGTAQDDISDAVTFAANLDRI